MSKMPTTSTGCLHCGYARAGWPRGLCRRCYLNPAVRQRYGRNDLYARRGLGIVVPKRVPVAPTAALPGSPEKLQVLIERAAAETDLWHPDDWGADVYFGPLLRRLRED
jgi:hypothetical protein